LAEFRKTLFPSLARISCHDQINSLDVTKAAQLLEERGIDWIASFAHVSDGDRWVNDGNAMLRSLLRARGERPYNGRTSDDFDEIAASHCSPKAQDCADL
jgi:hypothetical protein